MSNIPLNRREFLKTTSLGLLAGAILPLHILKAEKQKKFNILFIAVDDLRPQLSCYGHRQMISPNIDRLAGEGALFERAYCQVAVCGASRASLLTGIRPNRNRFLRHNIWAKEEAPGVLSLPKHLKQNGYHTVSNGKIYHHRMDDEEAWSEEPWRCKGEHRFLLESNIKLHNENQARTGGKGKNSRGPAYESADVPDESYPDHEVTEKSIKDMRRLKATGQPFFLAVGFSRPHLPFNAPKKYWDMYDQEKIDLADNPFRPKGAPDVALHNWGELRAYDSIPEEGPVSDETARNLIHGYYASTTFIDHQIGRLMDELDKQGLKDNTIVILWGDHGWQLGEHGLWCKHCNFETSVHVPMIIRAPGFKGGVKSNRLTEFIDIYPTLCELTGVLLPNHLEGTSFVPLMKDPDIPWKQAVFSRWFNGESLRTDRYRYTEWTDDNGQITDRMLYDHNKDPMENVNISEDPENKVLLKQLSRMLRKGWKHYQF